MINSTPQARAAVKLAADLNSEEFCSASYQPNLCGEDPKQERLERGKLRQAQQPPRQPESDASGDEGGRLSNAS